MCLTPRLGSCRTKLLFEAQNSAKYVMWNIINMGLAAGGGGGGGGGGPSDPPL